MPRDLAELYESSDGDVNLGDEIALLDARMAQLMLKLRNGSSDQELLVRAYRALEYAVISQDDADIEKTLNKMRQVIFGGANEKAVWDEIYAVVEARRKMVVDETRRVVSTENLISVTMFAPVIERLLASIALHVPDQETRNKISMTFRRTMGDEKLLPGKSS